MLLLSPTDVRIWGQKQWTDWYLDPGGEGGYSGSSQTSYIQKPVPHIRARKTLEQINNFLLLTFQKALL